MELISKPLADGQCEISVDISETNIDVFSWFRVWEQVTAVIEMCVAVGKMGRSIANGLYNISACTQNFQLTLFR